MGEKHTCCAEVWRGTEWRPRKEACGCKASVERDCKWYCKRHDPVALAEKKDEKQKIANAEWAAREKRRRLEQSAPDLLAALKDIENRLYYIQAQDFYLSMPQDIIDQVKRCSHSANSAIRKAEGES